LNVFQRIGQLAAGAFEFIVLLQVHPALRVRAEVRREAKGGVGTNAALLVRNLIYADWGS
jgi:hypothetical protein